MLGPTPDVNYQLELHYYCYPVSIVQNVAATLGPISNPGAGYANGFFANIPAIGGFGEGALLNITVSGGIVTQVEIAYGGSGYNAGDVLNATIGTSGSGFAVPIATVNNPNGTSWLGDNFDSVLLNGVLAEAATYMKQEPDMVQLYNQKFQESLMQLRRLGEGLEQGDSYRGGNPRVRVT